MVLEKKIMVLAVTEGLVNSSVQFRIEDVDSTAELQSFKVQECQMKLLKKIFLTLSSLFGSFHC